MITSLVIHSKEVEPFMSRLRIDLDAPLGVQTEFRRLGQKRVPDRTAGLPAYPLFSYALATQTYEHISLYFFP